MESDNDTILESQSLLNGNKEMAAPPIRMSHDYGQNQSQATQKDEIVCGDISLTQPSLIIPADSQTQSQSQEQSQSLLSKNSSVSPKANKRQTGTRVTRGNRSTRTKETKSVKRRRPNNNRDSSESESDTELKNKRKKHLKNESKVKDTNETTNVKDSTEQRCMVDAINKLADKMRLGMGELSQKMFDFEATITETIKKQVLNIVTPEIEKIKEDFNHKIHQMRQELQNSTQGKNSTISRTNQ